MIETANREIDITATLGDGSVESYLTEVWATESLITELIEKGAIHIAIEPIED